MNLTDDSLRGRVVLSSDGVVLGEIVRLFIDPSTLRIRSFEVRMRKDAAERAEVPHRLFHAATIELSTDLVQSIGDAVILSVSVEALRRTPTPPGPAAPAPP